MSRPELTLFSYEVMGLVGETGAGPHDLLQMARRGRILDWAGESQYYVEPKRLAKLGYLEAREAPGRTRARTVYSLTDKGRDALRSWARTPVTVTPLKSEPLLRGYHFLPSVRGDFLLKLGRREEARQEFERAAGLTRNARERTLLLERARQAAGGG